MEQEMTAFPPGAGRVLLPPGMTLAFQQMRQTWRLLTFVGLGMLAAVILVCATPLYSRVAMTAGLRAALTSSTQSSDIVVQGQTNPISSQSDVVSPDSLHQFTQSLNQEFQQDLGPYLLPAQFSWQTDPLDILAPANSFILHAPSSELIPTGDQMSMLSTDTARASSHLRFEQGRLPSSVINGNTIEIALLADIADPLHWGVGTILPVHITYVDPNKGKQTVEILQLRVVGVFKLPQNADPYWHGETFLNSQRGGEHFIAKALVSNEALITLFNQPNSSGVMSDASTLVWYYSLNTSQLQIGDIDTILQGVQRAQINIANNSQLSLTPGIQRVKTYFPTTTFTLYHDRLPVAQFPVGSLTALVLGLVLFFITLMTGILVDRQSGSIALLRSRGATSGQIFWSMVTQAVVLGLIALVIGPLLSVLLTHALAQTLLSGTEKGAVAIIAGNPVPVALSVGLFALTTICVMVLTMILATWSTANRDVLALRREAARSTHRPLWQRLHLDIVMVLIALVGGGFAFYLTNSNTLDARQSLLFLSPLALLETLCILLAAMLLLLRGFPLLLRASAWLAARRRGATPLLALAQMARAPRQSLRMTLLLALATAFVIFTLVFNASQTQRIQDVADFQAGADFSGSTPSYVFQQQGSVSNAMQDYRRLPGVQSVSLGYVSQVTAGGAQLTLNFQAVDTDTFAQTMHWSSQDSAQPLATLLRPLVSARTSAISKGVAPALVDAATWNELQLSPGAPFALDFSVIGGSPDLIKFQAVTEVQHIPTSGNSSIPGILVDYQTFSGIYAHIHPDTGSSLVPPNYVWLRSSDNPRQLSALRSALTAGDFNLTPLYDRRLTAEQLANDPLYRTLFGVLLLGAITALLLALAGNLVASWLNARARLASFAALRALGATPRQIAATLGWEQVIIYTTAMLLGLLFGWLLAILALPALIFTSIPPSQVTGQIDSAAFYAGQSTPPLQIVVPPALWIVLGALILLCILALGIMVRVVSRPSIAQVLRLNED